MLGHGCVVVHENKGLVINAGLQFLKVGNQRIAPLCDCEWRSPMPARVFPLLELVRQLHTVVLQLPSLLLCYLSLWCE